jgi:hypothetical protein
MHYKHFCMKKIFTYLSYAALSFICNKTSAQQIIHAQAHQQAHLQMVPHDTVPHVIMHYPIHNNVPLSRYRYLNNSNGRYVQLTEHVYQPINVLAGSQSIPQAERATSDDVASLYSTINSLLETVRNNYTESVDEFIDTVNDLDNLKKLQWINSYVRKSDVYGLNTNLTLLATIFQKDSFDVQDVEMISYIFDTDDSIINNMHIVNYEFLRYAGVRFTLALDDAQNNPVPYANCYFLKKSTWRLINKDGQCPVSLNGAPCNILDDLEQKNDGKIVYNSTSPQQDFVQLSMGPYHVVVAIDGTVYYHQIQSMDISMPGTFTINLLK